MVIVEGAIKGKDRPRFFKGHAVTSEGTMSYENWVRICYQQQDRRYLEGAIKATITIYCKVPKSYTKKRVQAIRDGIEHPQKKPDIDNVIKIILDSLNKIAYADDSQITDLVVKKRFTEELERVEFELEVLR